jgi:predicted deacylase
MADALLVGGVPVRPGQRQRLEIPVARLPTETWLSLPVEVVHGSRPGPRIWLSAAVHGDEINGVEIIRQVLEKLDPEALRGAVIAVPIVNVFGFIDQSRYLPDRRDLNRSFPGSERGSLAARLAHLFMTEVISSCGYGIDLHTGSNHRTNLPQIRANLRDPEARRLAEAFAAPVLIDAHSRDGSLRQAAAESGIHVLVYEAGEPLRFDPEGIQLGVQGILRVLSALGIRRRLKRSKPRPFFTVAKSRWIRARQSGILRLQAQLGDRVLRRQRLGSIANAFGDNLVAVTAPFDGLVIGHTNNPLVNQGDAVLHLATATNAESQ